MSIKERDQPVALAPGLDEDDKISAAEKTTTVAAPTTIENGDVEVAEPEKAYYSKLSVWLMVLFSGLAIGSDG